MCFQMTELVNTAILTGQIQSFPMRIYSLTQGGIVTDITSQTTCHSGDDQILKVSSHSPQSEITWILQAHLPQSCMMPSCSWHFDKYSPWCCQMFMRMILWSTQLEAGVTNHNFEFLFMVPLLEEIPQCHTTHCEEVVCKEQQITMKQLLTDFQDHHFLSSC